MTLYSVVGVKGMAIAAGISFLAGSALTGIATYKVTRAFADQELADYKAAAAQSRLDAAKADLRIDKGARDDAAADADVIDATDRRNEDILHDPPKPSASDCDDTVGDDGARWLRSIR